jgi:molybdenum cofactor cytidylyltransferase
LAGRQLGEIACQSLAGLNLAHQWVIASRADHPCAPGWRAAGFQVVVNAQAASGIGSSVALAATLAKQANVDGLLIALADMPFVTSAHCRALLDRAIEIGPSAIVASSANGVRSPPAAFGRDLLDSLAEVTGDVGARVLLRQAEVLACALGP